MEKADFILAGKLLRTTGIKSEIILSFDNGLPKDFLNLGTILIDIDGGLVPFFIENIKQKSSTTVVVKLEDVASEAEIKRYISSNFYLQTLDTIRENEDSYSAEIDGYELYDSENNKVGEIIDYLNIPNNPIIKILSTEKKELLIPFNDNLIVKISARKKRVIMKIPDGIMDI